MTPASLDEAEYLSDLADLAAQIAKCDARLADGTRTSPAASLVAAGVQIWLFRDRFQFCSGLVDLVICVRHHRGGGHRLALVGERFVDRFAECRA
jgi:hypothetical protein